MPDLLWAQNQHHYPQHCNWTYSKFHQHSTVRGEDGAQPVQGIGRISGHDAIEQDLEQTKKMSRVMVVHSIFWLNGTYRWDVDIESLQANVTYFAVGRRHLRKDWQKGRTRFKLFAVAVEAPFSVCAFGLQMVVSRLGEMLWVLDRWVGQDFEQGRTRKRWWW